MKQLLLTFPQADALTEGLNEEQLAAVMSPVDSATQVLAGAGTGKTELITRRFAKLTRDLASGGDEADPTERLWVSTFTDKAAQEMRERIASYLMQASGMPLSGKAWIGTFHSLCNRILQQQIEKLPHLAEYQLLTDVELELLRERLIQLLLHADSEALQALLNTDELPCDGHCLDQDNLAALDLVNYEGFFTEVVFNIVPRLKASGLSPQAFYHQAREQARQLTGLIEGMRPPTPLAEHEDYAAYWERQLKPISHDRFHFMPNDWLVEVEAQKSLAKGKEPPTALALMREHLKDFYKHGYFVAYNGRKRSAPFSEPVVDFSEQRAILALEEKLIEIVAAVYALYQRLLRLERACDFDDLIQEVIVLLENRADVRQYYQRFFAHFMVDEFQDSNGSQLRLIQLLSGHNPHITVVGDTKQSIYGFRFAEPENLHVLFQDIPAARYIPLKTNYRSIKPILDVANRVTAMMSLPQDESLHPCEANTVESPQAVTWLSLAQTTAVGEAKGTEIRWISETIARLLSQDAYAPNDIAVLVRDHRKALQLEAALDQFGIPAIRQRNLGFFQNNVIQQAVSLLELAENPHQDFALITLLQQKLTHHELYRLSLIRQSLKLHFAATNFSYYETVNHLVRNPAQVPPDLSHLMGILAFLVEALDQFQILKHQLGPEHLFLAMLQRFPLISAAGLATPKGQKDFRQLELLKNMLFHWSSRSREPLTLENALVLIHRYQAKNDLDIPVAEEGFYQNAVRLLTIHGSKGLQFPVVFYAGVDTYKKSRHEGQLTVDPQYPGKMGFGLFLNKFGNEKTLKKLVYDMAWKIPRTQEEELRLFYVGVTRAKERLYLSSWGQSFPYMNPVFFEDLPIGAVTETDLDWMSMAERRHLTQQFQAEYFYNPLEP